MQTTLTPRPFKAPVRSMAGLAAPKSGRVLKAEGIALAAKSNRLWLNGALHRLRAWLQVYVLTSTPTFTMEQFRAHCAALNLPMPHHGNAWGALTRSAVSHGLIQWTGEHVSAQAPTAHGRAIKLWRAL